MTLPFSHIPHFIPSHALEMSPVHPTLQDAKTPLTPCWSSCVPFPESSPLPSCIPPETTFWYWVLRVFLTKLWKEEEEYKEQEEKEEVLGGMVMMEGWWKEGDEFRYYKKV